MVMASEANPAKSPPFCVAEQRSEYSRFVDVVAGRVITKVWKCKFRHEQKNRDFISSSALHLCNRRRVPEVGPIVVGVRVDAAYVDVELGLPVDEQIPVKGPLKRPRADQQARDGTKHQSPRLGPNHKLWIGEPEPDTVSVSKCICSIGKKYLLK